MPTPRRLAVILAWLLLVPAAASAQLDVLRSVSALPAHLINQLQDPTAIVRTSAGEYLILDRRAHTLFKVDRAQRTLTPVLTVGWEPGHLLRPTALAISRDDIVAVLDQPTEYQRIQYFDTSGRLINVFYLPIVGTPQMVIGDVVVSGVGAMAFTGSTFLVADPAWGSLFAELDTTGAVLRHVGTLRVTGHEGDRPLHLALNSGLPVVDPTGGFYFVFQTGVPVFRRYDAEGRLLYERHVEGPELDALIQGLPTTWDRDDDSRPIVPPLVRTAAADDQGRLWVSVASGVTYVYDQRGEKVRTVQFRGAGVITPAFLSFRPGGRVVVTPGGYEFDTR